MRYRYRNHDELKDSGVEWLGKIPNDWEVKKIKHLFELKKDKSDEENPTVLSLTQKGLKIRDISNNEGQLASTYVGYTKIEKNDFILNPMDLISGYTDKAEIEGVISPAYTTFRSKNKVNINHDYYKRYFQMHYHHDFLFPWGEGVSFEHRWTLKNEIFLNLPVITSALEEQEKIANFLDKKTSQFDLIISKKEKLIERLEEAKKSLISEVVTGKVKVVKTDDGYELIKRSSEEMKDSGVEWLGEIPKDWEVKKVKHVISEGLKYGANESAELDDRELPRYIRITDFNDDGELKEETFKSLPEEKAKEYYLKNGDILFARSGGTVGKTFLFKNYDGKACYAGYLIKATPNNDIVIPEFLYSFTKSKGYDNWKNSIFMQATIQNIGADKYKELKFALPNITEQNYIIKYIQYKENMFKKLINKAKLQIEKLKEAKQSLISEAVTGKIEILD